MSRWILGVRFLRTLATLGRGLEIGGPVFVKVRLLCDSQSLGSV